MDELEIEPQVRADQMGQSVDVPQNEYTKASLDRRKGALNALEKALTAMQASVNGANRWIWGVA